MSIFSLPYKQIALMISRLLIVLLAFFSLACARERELRTTSVSPDGAYLIEIYRIVPKTGKPPGSSSDAEAEVVLKDRTGNLIKKGHVEMLQMAGPIEWATSEVTVGNQTVNLPTSP